MLPESIAILLVGILLITAFLRAKHAGFALGSLPVFFVPLCHLLVRALLYFTKGSFLFGVRAALVTAFADLLGIIASCVFVALFASHIASKKRRTIYLSVLLVYVVVLGWAYLFNSLQPLFG